MTSENNLKNKSSQYKLYELIDMNRGEIYHEFTHGIENRRGFWGFQPYYPSNGEPGFVNEEFIRFVESRDNYIIRRPIFHIATLTENFKNAVRNLSEYVENSNDKLKFYKNLRKLQEYLLECGQTNDSDILEEQEIDHQSITLYQDGATEIANEVANKLQLNTPKYIGKGLNGFAYDVGNNTVLKITSEKSEAIESMKARGKNLDHLANIYNVFAIKSNKYDTSEGIYAIVQEKIETNPELRKNFKEKIDRLEYIFNNILGLKLEYVLDHLDKDDSYEDHKEKIDAYMRKNPQDAEFFYDLLEISNELKQIGSASVEFLNPTNLGYKNGELAFFDMGFGNTSNFSKEPEKIQVDEFGGGANKFYGDNNVGDGMYPTYNQKSTEPSISNNLDANSAMYRENDEKNCNKDDDNYVNNDTLIEDRKKAWIPGAQAVTVKKKCRLGGLGNTSAACNQGDISNLEFSPLDEKVELDQGFVDGWNKYEILHDDEIAGEMEVSNRDKYMILNRIFINPEHRGMGHANDAMELLINYADKHNKIIALTPDNKWGASKEKLKKWYSSLGFKLNRGRNVDYKIQAAMIRKPQN